MKVIELMAYLSGCNEQDEVNIRVIEVGYDDNTHHISTSENPESEITVSEENDAVWLTGYC